MKKLFLLLFLFISSLFGQAPSTITGDIAINFATRTKRDGDFPQAGVEDVYSLNLNVANRALFTGTLAHRPFISNTFSANQAQQITYDVALSVVNPDNPKQSLNVGKVSGVVPINESNIYDYSLGTVKAAVFPIGKAKGFESKMSGQSAAKPPAKSGVRSLMDKAKERISLTRGSGTSQTAIVVSNYDRMDFVRLVLPAGPVALYSEATVEGTLLYDYDRSAWYLQGITVTYSQPNGVLQRDRVSGNIRWSEKTGRYELDVRLNEGQSAGGEAAVFSPATTESNADAEAAFFAVDTSVSALTGSITYKDVKVGGQAVSSNVTVDLTGNKLSNQQMVYLTKLLLLANIVPLSSD